MQVSFRSLYKIQYPNIINLSHERRFSFEFATDGTYRSNPTKQCKYDAIYCDIKDEHDRDFERACVSHGIKIEKVDEKAPKSKPEKTIYGSTPKDNGFDYFINDLKNSEIRSSAKDWYSRMVANFNDKYSVTYNKNGTKIVKAPTITLFLDKDENITRAIAPTKEFIYFPNGNSLEISLKDGKRTGDYTYYSKAFPEGIDVKSMGEKDGKKVSTVSILPFIDFLVVSDGSTVKKTGVSDIDMKTLDTSLKAYTPELLRIIAFDKSNK